MEEVRGNRRRRALIVLSFFFIFSEIAKQILLTRYNGAYDPWYFPFQLCSMPIYLLPLYLILPKEKAETVGSFLIDFSLLGGVMVFFDQSGLYYPIRILTLHSYLWHICMILMAVLLMKEGNESSFRKEAALFFFLSALAEFWNMIFKGKADMYYISPYLPMGQIVFRDIGKIVGNVTAILLYFFSILLGAYLIHQLRKKL